MINPEKQPDAEMSPAMTKLFNEAVENKNEGNALAFIAGYLAGQKFDEQTSCGSQIENGRYQTTLLKRLFELAGEPVPTAIAASKRTKEIYARADVDRLLDTAKARLWQKPA